MTTLPEAYVMSQIAGRTRLRVPARRGDVAFFEELADSLARCRGVTQVTTNPATASVLVLYRGAQSRFTRYAENEGLFSVVEKDEAPPSLRLSRRLFGSLHDIDGVLRTSTRNGLDTRSIVFAAFVAATFYQVVRGQVLPVATALAAFALNVLPSPEPRATQPGDDDGKRAVH